MVRGTVRVTAGSPKYALVIDSIERVRGGGRRRRARPQGRDWFVRAGESGGDGSREKPFRDPYQALEKAAPGDRIHVTGGEYGGKLKSGKWVVDKPWLALLGGYDRDFTRRDPWSSRRCSIGPPDSKTKARATSRRRRRPHRADRRRLRLRRRTLNSYERTAASISSGPTTRAPLGVLAQTSVVRNCVFVNGAGGAVRMSTGVTFENNIIVNVWHSGITVTASGRPQGAPAEIRNNTILFVWERRFHDASNSSGVGIDLQSDAKAIVEGNILQYVDNFAVKANVRLSELALNRNVFFLNWAALRSTAAMPPPTVAEHALGQLAELSFKQAEGNVAANGDFALDPAFYARWFARTSVATTRFPQATWQAIAPQVGGDMKAGIAPAYDFKQAATLVPRNMAVTAGARPTPLDVAFGR